MRERIAEVTAAQWASTGAAADASALGFNTLLFSDFDAMTPALRTVCRSATAERLAVWLTVTPDAAGAPRFDAHAAPPMAPWLIDNEAALDPRRVAHRIGHGPIAEADANAAAWIAMLTGAVQDGVRGFVCRDVDRLPPTFWSRVIDGSTGAAAVRWVAWTAGLPTAAAETLADAGFDTIVASVGWWDGRSRWLAAEFERAAETAKLVFPYDPFVRGRSHDAEQAVSAGALGVQQRLAIGALTGDALLVPAAAWHAIGPEQSSVLARINAQFAQREAGRVHLRFASAEDSPVTALVITTEPDVRAADDAIVALINPSQRDAATIGAATVTGLLGGFGGFESLSNDESGGGNAGALVPGARITIPAGGVACYAARRLAVVKRPVARGRRGADEALGAPRLAIEAITPSVDHGRFPVKRTAGEPVHVEADIVIDGHEQLAAAVLYRAAGDRAWQEVPMRPIGNDRFAASFPTARVGRHEYTIEAWRDVFATYRHELEKKTQAGLDVSLELIEGRRLIEAALTSSIRRRPTDAVRRLIGVQRALTEIEQSGSSAAAVTDVIAELLSSQTQADLRQVDARAFATRPDGVFPVDAERLEASFASWYELFPRSLGNPAGEVATHHGTFADVVDRLPAVRAMGFDVLYFPPIHPIGRKNRKGRNNSLIAEDADPGSPYAIGSADGGHDAIHPQLGTFEDFRKLRDAALEHGLEIALDFAIQCSPDHPWLAQHPGWFAWRPDGSIRYAENPPKKYEDIVNVDFYGEADGADAASALWLALRDVILLWCSEGVRIFRVDNPHTKPLPFWEWMIGDVRSRFPDAIFLSEAFTRPKLMYRLAKIGFSQSYTYFTWRHTKLEFVDYLTELTAPSGTSTPRDFFRPNFFVNTPDINPVFLQRSGRAGFLIRAALAATLSGLWGVYSGFELCEATPVPGKEDYLDSEKYQLRGWDWQRPGNIVAEVTALNRIRRENPAFRTHLNVRFQNVFDPNILYFMKATEDLVNVVLVAVNLDPYGVHEADFEIPLWQWNRPDDATVQVTDLLDGHRFAWTGKYQRMRLDPGLNPYAIWRVSL